MRSTPTSDAEPTTRPLGTQRDLPSSETMLDRGLWRAHASPPKKTAEPDPLEWVPAQSVRRRILRAVSVPAVAGGAVFVAAVVIAIIATVLQVRPMESLSVGSGESGDPAGALVESVPSGRVGAEGDEGTGHPEADPASGGAGGAAAEVAGHVTVHVVGEVARPGVLEVAAGTRVGELIEAAGGATDAAVLSAVNLARAVVDGEQVVIPNAEAVATAGSASGGASGAAVPSGAAAQPPIVNLNTADLGALDALPGIGPAIGQRILDWRSAHGAFASVDQLLDVPGVGEKMLEALRSQVIV